MDFDWAYEMPGYDAGDLQQYEDMPEVTQSFDWGNQGGGWDNFDFGQGGLDFSGLEGGSWQMPQQQQAFQPQQMELPSYEQPSGQQPFNQQPPASMGETAAPQMGGTGGSSREEESWLSRLAKAGLGMGVGAGTTVLGNVAQSALSKPQSSNRSSVTPAAPQALPAAPTTPTYTPEALEPLPGTKASPLISGRPTSVKGSAGLKERKPSYGGFTMY